MLLLSLAWASDPLAALLQAPVPVATVAFAIGGEGMRDRIQAVVQSHGVGVCYSAATKRTPDWNVSLTLDVELEANGSATATVVDSRPAEPSIWSPDPVFEDCVIRAIRDAPRQPGTPGGARLVATFAPPPSAMIAP